MHSAAGRMSEHRSQGSGGFLPVYCGYKLLRAAVDPTSAATKIYYLLYQKQPDKEVCLRVGEDCANTRRCTVYEQHELEGGKGVLIIGKRGSQTFTLVVPTDLSSPVMCNGQPLIDVFPKLDRVVL